MIKLTNLKWARIISARRLTKFEEEQIANKIAKFLLREYSIAGDWNVE